MQPNIHTTNIIASIRKELKQHADTATKASGERFFKEPVKLYGVKSAVVHALCKKYFKAIKATDKATLFVLCETLWMSGYLEESFIACNWSYYVHKQYTPKDFNVFEAWVKTFVSNWAACDTLCNHTVGTFVEMYPQYIARLKKWATSSNRWVRRAAAVSLIVPAKKGKFLDEVFEIADILLKDNDDMVQKGYGWLLKAGAHTHEREVFTYVMKHKAVMPRTALRYAIEKMPKALKNKAMSC